MQIGGMNFRERLKKKQMSSAVRSVTLAMMYEVVWYQNKRNWSYYQKVFLYSTWVSNFFYLKLFNSVYHFWGISMRSPCQLQALCSQKLSPNSSRPHFGIKWIVFCTKGITKVLHLTKKGSWRTSFWLPFFSPWDTPLPFTKVEVSKEYLKEYFQ